MIQNNNGWREFSVGFSEFHSISPVILSSAAVGLMDMMKILGDFRIFPPKA
jgi:hypothetical protein